MATTSGLTIACFLLMTFAPILLCVGGLNPVKFILPQASGKLGGFLTFSFRFFLTSMALAQIGAIIIASHLAFFIVLIHFKTSITNLKSYQPWLHKKDRNPIAKKDGLNKNQFSFLGCSDLELYWVICVLHRVVSEFTDKIAMFVMGSGFFIDVTYNYVVVKLYGRIPLLLYVHIAQMAVVVHTIIMIEVPQAGHGNGLSINLIQYWKVSNKRRRLRQKIVNSFRPVGIWVGPFFIMSRGTLFVFVNEILNKTIDFILLI